MLTLTRKSGECIRIGHGIRIVIREVRGRQVRIGIEAPVDVQIHREEVYLRIRDENVRAAGSDTPDSAELLNALVKAAHTPNQRRRGADEPFTPAKVIRRGPRQQTESESGVAPPA